MIWQLSLGDFVSQWFGTDLTYFFDVLAVDDLTLRHTDTLVTSHNFTTVRSHNLIALRRTIFVTMSQQFS